MITTGIPTYELVALARVSRAETVQSAVRAELSKRGVPAPERDSRHWNERLPAEVRAAMEIGREDAVSHALVWHPRYSEMAAEARQKGHTFDADRWQDEADRLGKVLAVEGR